MTNETELMPDVVYLAPTAWDISYEATAAFREERIGSVKYIRADAQRVPEGKKLAVIKDGEEPGYYKTFDPDSMPCATPLIRRFIDDRGDLMVEVSGWFYDMLVSLLDQVTKTPENVSCDLASQSGDSMAYAVASITPVPVDPDALKRELYDHEYISVGNGSIAENPNAEIFNEGVKYAIDHLHARGLIAGQPAPKQNTPPTPLNDAHHGDLNQQDDPPDAVERGVDIERRIGPVMFRNDITGEMQEILPSPVDLDALKKKVEAVYYGTRFGPDEFAVGWNAAIDHLHQRGLIRCVSNSAKS